MDYGTCTCIYRLHGIKCNLYACLFWVFCHHLILPWNSFTLGLLDRLLLFILRRTANYKRAKINISVCMKSAGKFTSFFSESHVIRMFLLLFLTPSPYFSLQNVMSESRWTFIAFRIFMKWDKSLPDIFYSWFKFLYYRFLFRLFFLVSSILTNTWKQL